MKIIKYCNSKYHIKNTRGIQIGTLNYYRKHDNEFIADPLEGTAHQVRVKSEEGRIGISKENLELLTNNKIQYTGDPNLGPAIQGIGENITVDFINPGKFTNLYVFSCSYEKIGNVETAKHLGYDSFYEIKDPGKFSKIVSDHLKKLANPKNNVKNGWKIKSKHKQVQYQDIRKTEMKSNSDLLNMVFHKTPTSSLDPTIDFRSNKEYRFVWMLVKRKDGERIEVKDEPIHITKIEDIKKICSF